MEAHGKRLEEVAEVFGTVFAGRQVRLSGGHPEPFYRAPRYGRPAEIRFTRDYLSSCLHEVAHWCLAGEARRRQDDYGYWYSPDGRDAEAQAAFFRAEARPQALEWAFAQACGAEFRISCDNLGGEVNGVEAFTRGVGARLVIYLEGGLPVRARHFIAALMARFHPEVEASARTAWLAARAEWSFPPSLGIAQDGLPVEAHLAADVP
jgi:elongation factor P hydroxylase